MDASLSCDSQTPLEHILGVTCAEKTYDQLTLREQLILDLLIVGWNQSDIAFLFQVRAPSIAFSLKRMRFKLANSMLKTILESRQDKRNGFF